MAATKKITVKRTAEEKLRARFTIAKEENKAPLKALKEENKATIRVLKDGEMKLKCQLKKAQRTVELRNADVLKLQEKLSAKNGVIVGLQHQVKTNFQKKNFVSVPYTKL